MIFGPKNSIYLDATESELDQHPNSVKSIIACFFHSKTRFFILNHTFLEIKSRIASTSKYCVKLTLFPEKLHTKINHVWKKEKRKTIRYYLLSRGKQVV